MIRKYNNTFLSGWRLNDGKLKNVKNIGAL